MDRANPTSFDPQVYIEGEINSTMRAISLALLMAPIVAGFRMPVPAVNQRSSRATAATASSLIRFASVET